MYSEKVMEHLSNPRNVGEIEDADGVGTVGNPVCGDLMTIYIKVKDNIIEDIKFKTFGCGAAIATSSMVTEMAKGKTLEEALAITRNVWPMNWKAYLRLKCTAPIWRQMLCIRLLMIIRRRWRKRRVKRTVSSTYSTYSTFFQLP